MDHCTGSAGGRRPLHRVAAVVASSRRWCGRTPAPARCRYSSTAAANSPLLSQLDLTFPDHTIQPVKLARDPVLRLPVSQGKQPHDDQRAARYVQIPPFGRGHDRLPHLEAMVRHAAYLGWRHVHGNSGGRQSTTSARHFRDGRDNGWRGAWSPRCDYRRARRYTNEPQERWERTKQWVKQSLASRLR